MLGSNVFINKTDFQFRPLFEGMALPVFTADTKLGCLVV